MIAIRFDGPPAHLSGRFVEVEQDGKGISFGEWRRDGKDWLLVLPETERLYGLVSYCAEHDTYPSKGEPCWQCANPHIALAASEVSDLKNEIANLEAGLRRYIALYRNECDASDNLKMAANSLLGLVDCLGGRASLDDAGPDRIHLSDLVGYPDFMNEKIAQTVRERNRPQAAHRHTDACLMYAARTGFAHCIAECKDSRLVGVRCWLRH